MELIPYFTSPLTVKSQRKQNGIKMHTFISLLNFQHMKLQIRVHILNATHRLNALGFSKRCISLYWQQSHICHTIYGCSEPYHSFFFKKNTHFNHGLHFLPKQKTLKCTEKKIIAVYNSHMQCKSPYTRTYFFIYIYIFQIIKYQKKYKTMEQNYL
jgi:hypothetical protein